VENELVQELLVTSFCDILQVPVGKKAAQGDHMPLLPRGHGLAMMV
jgi:hypothetical protein